jgi:hypothetical protein
MSDQMARVGERHEFPAAYVNSISGYASERVGATACRLQKTDIRPKNATYQTTDRDRAERRCHSCHETKPVTEFHRRNADHTFGRGCKCKECQSKRDRNRGRLDNLSLRDRLKTKFAHQWPDRPAV